MAETTFDAVFGIEPEGFIEGSSMAYNLGKGFVPVRKQGKLPYKTVAIPAGEETLEVHEDALRPGSTILLVGDAGLKMDAVAQTLVAHGLKVLRSA